MRKHYFTEYIEPVLNADTARFIEYLQAKGLLKELVACLSCLVAYKIVKYKRHRDGLALDVLIKHR